MLYVTKEKNITYDQVETGTITKTPKADISELILIHVKDG